VCLKVLMSLRGISLDRSVVTKRLEVAALRVEPPRTSEYLGRLKPYLLRMPRLRNAVDDGGGKKLILLKEEPPAGDEWLRGELERGDAERTSHAFEVGYDYFAADEALRTLLPRHVEVPSSFEQAGHVVHLNLRAEHEPYKEVIAQVVLDKTSQCRTVVNKVGDVGSAYRTFPLEVLAGDDDTVVTLKESDCVFEFDYRAVYWNSRLQAEHRRVVDLLAGLAASVKVADATCGVGPFALPLAKRGVDVVANDLNPAAVRALRGNRRRNKISDARLQIDGPGCARTFLRRNSYTHAILNLPAAGIALLDAFRGRLPPLPLEEKKCKDRGPLVLCYCFGPKADKKKDKDDHAVFDDIRRRLEAALGVDPPPFLSEEEDDDESKIFPSTAVLEAYAAAADGGRTSVRWIRNVAPAKDMFCVAFRVPAACSRLPYEGVDDVGEEEDALAAPTTITTTHPQKEDQGPSAKRAKKDSSRGQAT